MSLSKVYSLQAWVSQLNYNISVCRYLDWEMILTYFWITTRRYYYDTLFYLVFLIFLVENVAVDGYVFNIIFLRCYDVWLWDNGLLCGCVDFLKDYKNDSLITQNY